MLISRNHLFLLSCLLFSINTIATEVVLVGGGNGLNEPSRWNAFKEHLFRKDPKKTLVLFTGNYTKGGFTGKNHKNRKSIEQQLNVQLNSIGPFVKKGGRVLFLPGRNDFYGKRKPIQRLASYINKTLRPFSPGSGVHTFMPLTNCGDLHVEVLDSNSVLIAINSQWWMLEHGEFKSFNHGCQVKSRGEFLRQIKWALRKYRSKKIIIATHHPIETLGKYSSSIRGFFGLNQKESRYTSHARYRSYILSMIQNAQTYGRVLFLSGHEKGMQLLNDRGQTQIISSSMGKKASSFSSTEKGEFTSNRLGWVDISLAKNQVSFIDVNNGNSLYKGNINFGKRLVVTDKVERKYEKIEGQYEAFFTKRIPERFGFIKRSLLGDHYREAYRLRASYPVLDLKKRGFSVLKLGGGSQTNSIRLKGPKGGEWVIRSTTKVSSRILPYPFNKFSLAKFLLEDGFTASHPYGAQAVSGLSSSAGVFHTKPKAFYLPLQDVVQDYSDIISNEVVVMERRPKKIKRGILPKNLGGKKGVKTKYISTPKLIQKLRESPWKHQVNQENFLRARLLDIIVGDWDRHEDQWRFVGHKEKNVYLYSPIPRDRDQAFSNFDGMLLSFGRMAFPMARRFAKYKKNVGDLDWFNYGSKHMDPLFLNKLTYKNWMAIAKELKNSLSDSIIENSFKSWPKSFYDYNGLDLTEKVKSRRDEIVDVAHRFYKKTFKNVEILASEESDKVSLNYLPPNLIHVEIAKGEKTYYSRDFSPNDTKEIRIYGLAKKDKFKIKGKPHNKIIVRIVGGSGKDTISKFKTVKNEPSSLFIYDRPKGISLKGLNNISDERSESHYHNQFNYYDPHYEPDMWSAVPALQVNPDDGLFLGVGLNGRYSGFKRNPFKIQHKLNLALQTTTSGIIGGYEATIPSFYSQLDQIFGIDGHTLASGQNFFGYTNQVVNPRGRDERNQFRVRKSRLSGNYGLQKRLLGDDLKIATRAIVTNIKVERTAGRSVSTLLDSDAGEFEDKTFVGGEFSISLNTVDNPGNPREGLDLGIDVMLLSDIGSKDKGNFGGLTLLNSYIGVHVPFDREKRWVVSSRLEYSSQLSDSFPFYYAPSIGSNQVRSFNDEQLRGNAALSHATDFRYEAFRIKETVPSTIDLVFSADHGRVYGKKVAEKKHSFSVGAGAFWNILDTTGVGLSYHQGPDDINRIALRVGNVF